MNQDSWLRRRVVPIANKLVYASTAYVDLKSSINGLGSELIDGSRKPETDADQRVIEVMSLVRPQSSPQLRLIRVGGDGDGGYVMNDDFDVRGAISVGVGPDVSWDADIASRGVSVAMFDPTVKGLPQPVPNGRFFRIGIGTDSDGQYLHLNRLIGLAGFAASDRLLLKIDVEGAEWSSLASIAPSELHQFSQITMEFHDFYRLRDEDSSRDVLAVLRALHETHVPVHVHANNYSALTSFGNLWFPEAIEVTYVRRDDVVAWSSASTMRSDLDRPCDPRVADIPLAGLLRTPQSA